MASAMGGVKMLKVKENKMKQFYCNVWLPFMEPKRRIFLLALAAYIALC